MSGETTSKPLRWLITGCSSGFGLALARIAQAKGHHVIATSRNPARTPELVDEIKSKGGRWEALDLQDPSCGKVIEDLEKEGLPIDVLVNNAGMSFFCPTDVLEETDLKQLFETNFFGPWRLIKAAGPHMRQRRTGTVVNISSGGSIRTHACFSAYGSSKAALDGKLRRRQVTAGKWTAS
jgi:short-subunit dehydrogenase